jgi:3-phenylpropionate/cinnamic acid dioxygenase small subunit
LSKEPGGVTDREYREIVEFLYDEAELLDARRYEEWLTRLGETVRYRMTYPLMEEGRMAASHAKTSPLFDETASSLAIRVQQLGQPSQTIAENPPTVTRRFVTNIRVRAGDAATQFRVTSNVLLCRFRFSQPEPAFLSARREDVIEQHAAGLRVTERTIRLDESVVQGTNLSFFI